MLRRSFERKSDADLDRYRVRENAHSIDGLPAVPPVGG